MEKAMNKILTTAIEIIVYSVSSNVFAEGYSMGEWSGHMWGSGMKFASLMMIGCFALFVLA